MIENQLILPNNKDRRKFQDPTPVEEHPLFVMGDTLMKAFYEVSELAQGLGGERPVNIEAYMELLQRDDLKKTLEGASERDSYILHGDDWSEKVVIEPKNRRHHGYIAVHLYAPPLSDIDIMLDNETISSSPIEIWYAQDHYDYKEMIHYIFQEPIEDEDERTYRMVCNYGHLKNGDHMLELVFLHGKFDEETDEPRKKYEFQRFLDKDGRKLTDEEMKERGYSYTDPKYYIY